MIALVLFATLAWAGEKPAWFAADYKTSTEWAFFCSAEGKTEEEALGSARATCATKICGLFGMEVESTTTTTEGLKDISVTSQVTEKCPKVRVVGRVEKKKVVSCEEEHCEAYVQQVYSKEEFDLEKKRQAHADPDVRDPEACRKELRGYSAVHGEATADSKKRVAFLEVAAKVCKGLDVRNGDLQEELRNYLVKSFQVRAVSTAVALGRVFQEKSGIEDKIALFAAFERRLYDSGGRMKEIAKFVSERFDAIFVRNASTDQYLEELRTCHRLAEITREWPGDLTGEIKACVGSECRSTSILLMRAQFAGCVCDSGQECARETMQIMNELCPREMDKACYAKVVKTVAERVRAKLKKPD